MEKGGGMEKKEGEGTQGGCGKLKCSGRTRARSGGCKLLRFVKGSGTLLAKAPCNPKGNQ